MKYIKLTIILLVLFSCNTLFAFDFSTHGYFRNRIVADQDMDLQKPNRNIADSNDSFGFMSYNQMRLRLNPTLKLNDNLSIHTQFDILDNILYGTSNTDELNILSPAVGTLVMPPGAGSFSMVGGQAGENGSINVRRVWADILTPIGKFRLGRQPLNWGLGIFLNDGNEMQGDFGDTADGIMYIAQFETLKLGTLSAGLLWGIPFEAQSDLRTQTYYDRVRNIAANSRDTQQYSALFMLERDDISIDLLGGIRRRNGQNGATTTTVTDRNGNTVAAGIDGDTFLYFFDLYAKYVYENFKFQLEGVYVGGNITTGIALDEIPFQGVAAGTGIIQLPQKQPVRVFMGAFQAEGKHDFGGEWVFQTGYAPGDQKPLSSRITQLGFRPDYQVALMMFNQPMGTSPTLYDSTSGARLSGGQWMTGNYINNALYVSAGYKHSFDLEQYITDMNEFKIGGKITTAWAPKKNININFSDLITTVPNLPILSENASTMLQRWYGLEVDLSVEARFFEHLYTAIDGGIMIPGRAYNIDVGLIDVNSIVKPVPKDKANIAWMFRGTVVVDF
ncbi:MAG: hypothetical protein ABIE74_05520 [Pseudomonadota bacterium]